MISLKKVSKTYQMGETTVHALRDVSLDIADGDFVAIMGPSGSGKSTLAHILGLLDVPNSGSYLLNAREVSKLSEDDLAILRREEIGFIFQQFNLLPRMSALENVGLPMLYSQKKMDLLRASSLLETVGLGTRVDHKPNELSGGQQQRVAIARSLINQPRMILADEPTGNLDSGSETEIMTALKNLNAQGITVIIVTHEEDIGAQAKRLIRMRDGVILSDERQAPLPALGRVERIKNAFVPSTFHLSEVVEHFRQGFKTLAANKIRTGLSMLGILIGVAAVVAMLAIGRGAESSIKAQLSSLGSNLLVLRSGARRVGGVAQEAGATTRLTNDDAQAIQDNIAHVKFVGASVSGRVQLTYNAKNWNTQLQGADVTYPEMHAAVPARGRFFSANENRMRTRVAVLGTTVVKELFGMQSPIGENIKINRVNFQVIGVLPEKGGGGFRDQDDIVIVPVLTAMHRLLGKAYVDDIEVEITDPQSTEQAQDDLNGFMLNRKHIPDSQKDDAFQIMNLADIQEALSKTSQTLSVLLASIAAISLLVGGIGIMNIMLVSVTERTKEIGLRKAVGARKRDILFQFLTEAVVVSAVGGVIGIILGWLMTVAVNFILNWETVISVDSVALAFGFSALIGMVFGIYPARKASQLHPIDALRYE